MAGNYYSSCCAGLCYKSRMAKKYTITEAAKKLKVTRTDRLAQLLRDARAWDQRYELLCENFCFGDAFCLYISPEDHTRWNVPRVVDGRLFTRCG
jgi:transcriptional regulator of met regulon